MRKFEQFSCCECEDLPGIMRVDGVSTLSNVSVIVIRGRPETLAVLIVSDDWVGRGVIGIANLGGGLVIVWVWPGTLCILGIGNDWLAGLVRVTVAVLDVAVVCVGSWPRAIVLV
jgi:hypothetical protein